MTIHPAASRSHEIFTSRKLLRPTADLPPDIADGKPIRLDIAASKKTRVTEFVLPKS